MPIIIGIIFILIGVGLFFGYRSAKNKMLDMASTETSTAAALQELAASIAKEIGEGSFNQICEVKGVIKCNIPLTSALTKRPCVYYQSSVTEEYEETHYERDSQGRDQRRTRTKTNTISSNHQQTDFFIEDQTGKIKIIVEGADWDPEVTCDEVRQTMPNQHYPNTQYKGTRYRESAVLVDRLAYVLGQARDAGGLSVRKPEGDKRFMISLKSEEDLMKKAQGAQQGYKIGAIVCGAIGVVVLLIGLVS